MTEYITKHQARIAVDKRISELTRDAEFNYAKAICVNGVKSHINSMPTADVVEREKIDKAIEEIKAESFSEHIDEADCDDILIVELRDVLEILKRNIGV